MFEPLTCVNVHLNGWRDVVILKCGRRWVLGFLSSTLEKVKLDKEALREARPVDYPKTRLAKRLRSNAKTYQRRGRLPTDGKYDEPTGPVVYPHKAVRVAIAEIGKR